MMGPMTTSYKSVIVCLCSVFLMLAGTSDSALMVGFEQPSYNVSEEDGMVMLSFDIVGPTMDNSIQLNLTISDPSDSGRLINEFNFFNPITVDIVPMGGMSPMQTANVSIPIDFADEIVENTETFEVILSSSDSEVSVISPSDTNINIEDNDMLMVGFMPILVPVSESEGTFVMMLVADGMSAFDYTVTINITNFATDMNDYNTTSSFDVGFSAGDSTGSVVVNIDDDVFEEEEVFLAKIVDTSNSQILISTSASQQVVTIEDDEVIEVSFQNESVMVLENEGEVLLIILTNAPTIGPGVVVEIVFDLSFSSGTALSPGDYTDTFNLTALVNDTMGEVSIPIVDNVILEESESFTVTMVGTDPRIVVDTTPTAVTIIDDEVLIVEFVMTEYNVSESDGTVEIVLEANGTSQFDYSVNLSIGDIGTDSADYNISSIFQVEFPAGSNTSSVVIAIDDDVFEFSETFTLTINSTSDDGVLSGANSQTTVNIEDDEMITVFFQEDPFSFSESDGEAVVTLYADLPTGGLEVNITLGVNITNGTATSPADYYDDSLMYVTLLATTNSMTTADLRITIQDEDILERDEDFTIMLDTMETRVNIVNSTSVVIVNDDVLAVEFWYSELNVSEAMGTVEVTVIANGTSEFDYTVNLTTSDITTDSNDHNLTEYIEFEFPTGITSASVVIAIDDIVYENTESFQVAIASTSDEKVLIGMNSTTTLNVEDDEMIAVFFQEDTFSFSESDGEAVLTVYADLPTGGLAVNITLGVNITDGTATSPADYDASLMYVTLLATTNSMTTAELRITIQDEDILERDEGFAIMLDTMETRVNIVNSTSVTILNDDAINVDFNITEYNVTESEETVTLHLVANETSEFDYFVTVMITNISTDANDHNVSGPIDVEFPAGSTSASVVIAIDDNVYENTESFQLAITSTSEEDVLMGMNNEITVNIEDDEMITVFFQENPFSFSESVGEAVVMVYADLPTGGLAVNITLGVNITNRTAISQADYDASLMYVTLLATNNSMTTAELRITIQDEDILERDEDFIIMLDTMEIRVNIANSTSVVILNDDALLIDLEASEINVGESNGTVTLRLMANGTSEFDYNIDLIISDVSTNSDDYNITSPFQVGFTAGSMEASIVVYIDDDVYEADMETFIASLSSPDTSILLIGMNNETTVNIEDDEMITVFFQEDSYSFSESDGEAVVPVYANLPAGGLAVNITLGVNITNGTAISPADYDASLMYVTLYATTSIIITVELRINILDEDILENDEDFNIMLSTLEIRLAISISTSVIILNDDFLYVAFQSTAIYVSEQDGIICIVLVANGTSEFNYVVHLTLSDVTTVQSDYSITPETLRPTFTAGTSTVKVYIVIVNDTIFEGTQSFELSLSSVSTPNVIFHSNNQTTVYILDDEMITVFFSSYNFTAMESDGEAVVDVNASLPSGGTEVTFSVGTSVTPGTARVVFDYDMAAPPNVTFGANMTSSELRIPLVNDDTAEPDEQFTVNLVEITRNIVIATFTANVTVIDDDPCPCENGGTCVFDNNNINCTCAENFIGQFCQTAVADPFSDTGVAVGVSVAAGAAGIGLVAVGICIMVAVLASPK